MVDTVTQPEANCTMKGQNYRLQSSSPERERQQGGDGHCGCSIRGGYRDDAECDEGEETRGRRGSRGAEDVREALGSKERRGEELQGEARVAAAESGDGDTGVEADGLWGGRAHCKEVRERRVRRSGRGGRSGP